MVKMPRQVKRYSPQRASTPFTPWSVKKSASELAGSASFPQGDGGRHALRPAGRSRKADQARQHPLPPHGNGKAHYAPCKRARSSNSWTGDQWLEIPHRDLP